MHGHPDKRSGLGIEAGGRGDNCLLLLVMGHDAQEIASDRVLLDLKLGLVAVTLGLFCGFFLGRGLGFLKFDALESGDPEGEELVIIVV